MNAPALDVRGLGKRFAIGARVDNPTFLQAARSWATGARAERELWAIKDVSFRLEPGEVLGVIGPNGAGKSTLLLLLAEVLRPTEGRVAAAGRAGCFFQLSAGLQPDLTVRDNFALCAALLGLDRAAFEREFEGMLAFSGLESYLDARLSELSTGLAARLPFSVAVRAPVDVLLVDEMLSVGDQAFQGRCVEAIRGLLASGRCLVLVSHGMSLIRSLCPRTLYLDAGRPVYLGDTGEAIARYSRDYPASAAGLESLEARLRASDGILGRLERGLAALESRAAVLRAAPAASGPDPAALERAAAEVGRLEARLRAADGLLSRLDRNSDALELRAASLRAARRPPSPEADPRVAELRRAAAGLDELSERLSSVEGLFERLEAWRLRSTAAPPDVPAPRAEPAPTESATEGIREKARAAWSRKLRHDAPLEIVDSFRTAVWCSLAALCDASLDRPLAPGDEVLMPACAYPGAAAAIEALGLTAVLVDLDENFALSPEIVAGAAGPRTRAVVLPHLLGPARAAARLASLCAERGLSLVEHGTHPGTDVSAHGATAAFGRLPHASNPWAVWLSRLPLGEDSPLRRLLAGKPAPAPAALLALGPRPLASAEGLTKALVCAAGDEDAGEDGRDAWARFCAGLGVDAGVDALQPAGATRLLRLPGGARGFIEAAQAEGLPVIGFLGGCGWAPAALPRARLAGALSRARALAEETAVVRLPRQAQARRDSLAALERLLGSLLHETR